MKLFFKLVLVLVIWVAVLMPLEAQETAVTKQTLVMANRILAMEGLVGPYGHVSVRSEKTGMFWVADHRSPDTVTIDHLVEVPISIEVKVARERGLYREINIHAGIYQGLSAVRAVVHTHSPRAVALGTLAAAGDRVFPTTNPGANLGNFIPMFRTIGLIDTPEEGSALANRFQGQNGLLLRGHGTVTVGDSLEQAVLRAIYLEQEARAQLWSRAAGDPIYYMPQESDVFKRTVAVEHAWDYYVGKLKRLGREGSR